MPAHRIDFFLNSTAQLRGLSENARRLAGLNRILVNYAPAELTQSCRVKQLRDGTLTLVAENAAIAAKLRQITTRLLAAYQNERTQVTAIRIEVQVGAQTAPSRGQKRELTLESIEKIEKLAARLEDSPLKEAVRRLARRRRPPKRTTRPSTHR